MNANMIAASVIVPTYNRVRVLLELLESLRCQTLPRERFEVLIMDNQSTDNTQQAVCEFAEANPGLQLRFIRMPENRGPVVSRNRGAREATGSLLFFTDSDVSVGPDWLERGLAAFEQDPNLAMAAGPTVDKPNQPQSFFSTGTSNSYDEDPIYPTSNVIYRKDVFEEIGGFDERTSDGHVLTIPLECSDVDMAWRVRGAGHRSTFLREMVAYHEVRVESPARWVITQLRVIYLPLLIRRHPVLRKYLLWFGPFARPENLYFYIALAALLLALWFGSSWWLIGLLPLFLRFLPFLRPSWKPLQWPKLAAQFVFIVLRQCVICGALVYGSFRYRTVVL